jgi:hypothetical protein
LHEFYKKFQVGPNLAPGFGTDAALDVMVVAFVEMYSGLLKRCGKVAIVGAILARRMPE